MGSPKHGVAWDEKTGAPKVHGNPGFDYAQTKAVNVLLAQEYQTRYDKDGMSCKAEQYLELD